MDNTSRVQTVCEEDNPNFYRLIKEFYKKQASNGIEHKFKYQRNPIVNTHNDGIEFEKNME